MGLGDGSLSHWWMGSGPIKPQPEREKKTHEGMRGMTQPFFLDPIFKMSPTVSHRLNPLVSPSESTTSIDSLAFLMATPLEGAWAEQERERLLSQFSILSPFLSLQTAELLKAVPNFILAGSKRTVYHASTDSQYDMLSLN